MSSGESQRVTEFKNTVAASLKQQINNANLQENAVRFGSSAQTPQVPRQKNKTKNKMREAVKEKLFEQFRSISVDMSGAVAAAATIDGEDKAVPTHWRRLNQFFGDDYRKSSRDKWEKFLMEPCIPPDENPIYCWTENTKCFKKLGQLGHS